jgi:hypothetical protein
MCLDGQRLHRAVRAADVPVVRSLGGKPRILVGPAVRSLAQNKQPSPLPKAIVEAWTQAGAETGWRRITDFDRPTSVRMPVSNELTAPSFLRHATTPARPVRFLQPPALSRYLLDVQPKATADTGGNGQRIPVAGYSEPPHAGHYREVV